MSTPNEEENGPKKDFEGQWFAIPKDSDKTEKDILKSKKGMNKEDSIKYFQTLLAEGDTLDKYEIVDPVLDEPAPARGSSKFDEYHELIHLLEILYYGAQTGVLNRTQQENLRLQISEKMNKNDSESTE